MEKQQLIVRKKGEQDKRLQIVSLTDTGRTLEQQAYKLIPAGMDRQFCACPLDPEDNQNLASELDSIIETLKNKTADKEAGH